MANQPRAWAPALTPARAETAVTIAREVAARVTDEARLPAAIDAAPQQTAFPEAVHWVPYSLAQGEAGLALMCAYLDACFPGENWDRAGHRLITTAARAAERVEFLPPGAFVGLAGLTFVTWSLSRGGSRYQRMQASFEDTLLSSAVVHAQAASQEPTGVSVGAFDAISGLSGIGACLLARSERPEARAVLGLVLSALVRLCEREDSGLPRWHTPPHLMADQAMARAHPGGTLNCGLAHGIPGPLALMALALGRGVEVDGQRDALRRTCEWLLAHRADDDCGINWPTVVPIAPEGEQQREPAPLQPSRSAWCYGSPGVARALWLSGDALDDADLREMGVAAMEAVYRRPIGERRIDSPTFCHGVAGLLHITLRFAHDTGLPVFTDAANTLADQMLAAYEPDGLLGYRSVEPGDHRVDQAGLLDGAAGIAMMLLAAATHVEPSWDRLFLLA